MNDGRRAQALAIVFSMSLLIGSIAYIGLSFDGTDTQTNDPSDRPEFSTQLRELQEAGVTGEDVSVGVVVATGVNPNEPSYEGQVVATRSFVPGETIRNRGRNRHGTATTAQVARVAPDVDLYLASFERAEEFERAMSWLQRNEVDVVVAPIAFYGRPGDGSSPVARTATRASRSGVTVVGPVGNIGQGHWHGEFTPTGAGLHQFSGETRNYIRGRQNRQLTVWLSWRGSQASTKEKARPDFTLELYRQRGDTTQLVRRSRSFDSDNWPNEILTTRIDPRGTYYVTIRGPTSASGTHLEISSPTHVLQYRERGGSVVAPATAPAVIAVGAFDPDTENVRPFSSAGPVDGRPGVDLVAPDGQRVLDSADGFVGTSAASAYTAGVVALLLATNPDLTPDQVEAVLQATAHDTGPAGVDPVNGYGRIAPRRAVARARNVSA